MTSIRGRTALYVIGPITIRQEGIRFACFTASRLLTVFAEVAFGLANLGTPRDETKRRVREALQKVGFWELRDRSPFELSGGQQQRLAIASVLAMAPPILVLDEAASRLDPSGTREIWQIIPDLHQSGCFRVSARGFSPKGQLIHEAPAQRARHKWASQP
ncbi:MAG: energy-coupling factor ABC transporter ATP-binding protein [Bacillota bacterium]